MSKKFLKKKNADFSMCPILLAIKVKSRNELGKALPDRLLENLSDDQIWISSILKNKIKKV